MKKTIILFYGVLCYALFNIVFLYLLGFLLNVFVPKSIDSGGSGHWLEATAVNIGLIALFGGVHSIMARRRFKQWWTRIVPPAAERSTYVLQASLLLALVMWQWRPLPATIWQIDHVVGQTFFYVIFALGVGIVLLSTFLINHFELFGLQQVYHHMRNEKTPADQFKTPLLYKLVRHPMQLGVIITVFATPHLTAGHLLFAAAMTIYIVIGIYFEEKALVRQFGDEYCRYQQSTPRLIPGYGRQPIKTAAAGD